MPHLDRLEKGVLFVIGKKLDKLRAIKGIHQYSREKEFFDVLGIPKEKPVKCVTLQYVYNNHPRSVIYRVLNELDILINAFIYETDDVINERRVEALPLVGLTLMKVKKEHFLIKFENYYIDFNFHEEFSKY